MSANQPKEPFRLIVEPERVAISLSNNLTFKQASEEAGYLFPGNCGGKEECFSCRIEFLSDPPRAMPVESRLFVLSVDNGSDGVGEV